MEHHVINIYVFDKLALSKIIQEYLKDIQGFNMQSQPGL